MIEFLDGFEGMYMQIKLINVNKSEGSTHKG